MGSKIQKRQVGNGTPRRNGRLGILVEFDSEMFRDIRNRAIGHEVSFAEEVRTLIEWGLESASASKVSS